MNDTDNDRQAASGAQGAQSNPPRTPHDTAAALIYTTFPSETEANRIGRALVEARLAACVNIFAGMTAIFAWEGAIDEAREAAMIVKTTAGRVPEALTEIKRLHPYSTPARLVLPVAGGGEDFLQWIAAQTQAAMP